MAMGCCCTCLCWFLVVLQFSCLWIIVGMLRFGQCQEVSFEFSEASKSFVAGNLVCYGDCQFSSSGSSVVLPLNGSGVGRLMYSTPIRIYNSSAGTVASFSTQFVFQLVTATNRSYVETADGFTFLIAPSPGVPPNSGGGALGLFAPQYSGDPADGTTNLVALEFDTFVRSANPWDPGYFPHVGLDLNSLNSSALSARNDPVVSDIIGNPMGVWINYEAANHSLQVDLAVIKPGQSAFTWTRSRVLTYANFSLSAFVNEESYIGFSASTGLGAQLNTITFWKFQTSFGDELVPAPEPVPVPIPTDVPARAPAAPANPAAGPGIDPSTTPAGRRKYVNVGLVIGLVVVAVGVAVGVALLSLVAWWWWRRSRSGRAAYQASRGRPGGSGDSVQLPEAGYGPRSIKYDVLHKATKGFTTMLGEGGSGGVFLAVLSDGTRVAVKKIKEGSQDGEKQFLAEVSTIGQLSHKNLVTLRGWCQDHGELLLVYDYMPSGSLNDHLYDHDTAPGSTAAAAGLDWQARLNIIKGVADALLYIHQGWKQPVIHRDIKPSNVMLDEDFNAVLGDFGLAVVMRKHKVAQTVTKTAGTQGYLAPECLKTGKVGAKSDLFSFGVLALEVVCGRRPIDWCLPKNECILVTWVWSLYIEDRLPEAVHPRFRGAQGATEVVLVGLMCSFPDPAARPNMSLVTQFLSGSIPVPPLPKEISPAAFHTSLSPQAENYLAMIQALNSASTSTSLSSGAPRSTYERASLVRWPQTFTGLRVDD